MSKRVRITVDVLVDDESKLRAYAEKRCRARWQDPLRMFQGDSLAGAVYEALVGSNEGPDVEQFGLELDGYHAAEVDDDGAGLELLHGQRPRVPGVAVVGRPDRRARHSALAERGTAIL